MEQHSPTAEPMLPRSPTSSQGATHSHRLGQDACARTGVEVKGGELGPRGDASGQGKQQLRAACHLCCPCSRWQGRLSGRRLCPHTPWQVMSQEDVGVVTPALDNPGRREQARRRLRRWLQARPSVPSAEPRGPGCRAAGRRLKPRGWPGVGANWEPACSRGTAGDRAAGPAPDGELHKPGELRRGGGAPPGQVTRPAAPRGAQPARAPSDPAAMRAGPGALAWPGARPGDQLRPGEHV